MHNVITDEEIVSAVYDVLQRVMGVPRNRIRPSARLVADLHMDRDLEFNDFVLPGLERRLEVRIDPRGWDKVSTVQDMIQLLQEQRDKKRLVAGSPISDK